MEYMLLIGIIFSLNVLYLVTCAFVMMRPEDVSAIQDTETDTHRVESAVIVNSLVLGVLGLFCTARLFSAMGEGIVELLYQIVSDPTERKQCIEHNSLNHAQLTLLNLKTKPKLSSTSRDYANL